MTGSGYALSDEAILKAHDAAIADDYTVFYPTFFSEVRAVGSPDYRPHVRRDRERAGSSAWPATTSSMATPATR